MAGFDDPFTMALLAAGGAMMDPDGGMGAGMQAGVNAFAVGSRNQQQKLANQTAQDKLMRKLNADQMLQQVIKEQGEQGPINPVNLAQAMLKTQHPDLVSHGLSMLKDFRPKVKTTNKVMRDGQSFTQPVFDDGSFGDVNELPAAEKLMQVNTGNQALLVNPMTGAPTTGFNMGMAPGEAARLAQSDRQHQDSMSMQGQRLMMDRRNAVQPKFVDGAWIYPPTQDSPQGNIVPTDMFVPPKNSPSAAKMSAGKVNSLLDEAEGHIDKATGSLVGRGRDMLAGAVGVSTEGAQNIASLKTVEAGLIMNMPRLEGPQSNLDQQLYREAAGQIGDPTTPAETKKAAIKTLRTIQNRYPDAFGNLQNHSQQRSTMGGGGFSARRLD